MKTLMNAIVALALVGGFAATTAEATPMKLIDTQKFWEQQERNRGSL